MFPPISYATFSCSQTAKRLFRCTKWMATANDHLLRKTKLAHSMVLPSIDDSYCPTYLTTWIRVLHEKSTVTQIISKFSVFYGILKFTTVFTKAPPPVPILTQMHPVHTITISSHLPLGLPNGLFLSFRFTYQNSVSISHLLHAYYMPRPSHSP